jgi:hypothetical protein
MNILVTMKVGSGTIMKITLLIEPEMGLPSLNYSYKDNFKGLRA